MEGYIIMGFIVASALLFLFSAWIAAIFAIGPEETLESRIRNMHLCSINLLLLALVLVLADIV